MAIFGSKFKMLTRLDDGAFAIIEKIQNPDGDTTAVGYWNGGLTMARLNPDGSVFNIMRPAQVAEYVETLEGSTVADYLEEYASVGVSQKEAETQIAHQHAIARMWRSHEK